MTSPQGPNGEKSEKQPGDQAVAEFAAHYRRAYPQLTTVAAAVLGRQEGAEDVVQQAAGIAVAKRKRFASAPAFVAWMIGVVRRCALNHRRKTQRRRTYAADPADIAKVPSTAPAPDSPLDPTSGELYPDQASFEDHVLEALQQLSSEARCCLLLRTVQELSYAEIAQLLQIPAGTAMSHVHRSRRLLRNYLTDGRHRPAASDPDPHEAKHQQADE